MPLLQTDAETPRQPVIFTPPPTTHTDFPDGVPRTDGPFLLPSEPPHPSDRNRPSVHEPSVTVMPTEVVATPLPTFPVEESPIPIAASPTHKSQIATAALVGISVALGVVFVGALFALIWLKRKRDRQRGLGGSRSRRLRGGSTVDDEAEKAPPSYEAAVYGTSSDSDRWSQHQNAPEAPILQSPPPTHQGIIAPRPISTNSILSLRRLDTITTSFPPQSQPPPPPPPPQSRQPEIIIFPHDSPVLAPENDDALSLRAALRMSQSSSRVLYSNSRASGRFTENFDDHGDGDGDNDDTRSVVSDLREDERIVETEIV